RRRRHRPRLEALEDRTLLAVDITLADFATGQFTFTGDRAATTADNLVLSVQGGLLAHNLTVIGGTGNYSSATDFDPAPATQTLAVGAGTAPLIRVNLLTDNDSLRIDQSGGVL